MIDEAIDGGFFLSRADQNGVDPDDAPAFADHLDLLVADVAFDVVIAARIGVRDDQRLRRDLKDVVESGRADVGQIDHHSKPVAFFHDLAPKRGQAAARRTTGCEERTIAGRIPARMGEPDGAHTQFEKDAQKIEISAQRLHALHRNHQRDFPGGASLRNILVTFANGEAVRLLHLRIESRDLIERHSQRHFR